MVEGVLQSSPEGTPQGGPLSPLLANILLDDLDKELERRGLPFVRYADDFLIFTKTRRAAERVLRAGEADETVREPRPVDSAASADVLLETLAVCPHAGSESLGDRHSTPTGLPPRKESKRPVAHGQNHCQRGRDDERLAARSGTAVAEITLGQACSAPSNRVVQTRMLRGVGGGRSNPPAYPILPCGSDALCGNLKSAVDRPFSVPQLGPFMTATPYTAVIRRDGRWWIGWVEEVPGVNSQGETREELLSNLREALAEAIEMNREDARKAAGEQFEEVALQP